MSEVSPCPHAKECSGCSLWETPYAQQVHEKTERLAQLGRNLGYQGAVAAHSAGPVALRDRADLQWRAGEGWGFLDKTYKQIKVIDQCPLFTEPLQGLFAWWSTQKMKGVGPSGVPQEVAKASVRLRVDEQGRWGVWLDMANVDVKDLLQNDALLSEWVSRAHVEIGQRHKVLRRLNGAWKLVDPELRPWFQTRDLQENKFNLYGSVGSFSQVGRAVNALLVTRTLEVLRQQPGREILELGAGSGNFTLAFAAEGYRVQAFEQSAAALEGLQRALHEYPALASKIEFQVGNFQKVNWGSWARNNSVLFLDPPRSGVGANLLAQVNAGGFTTVVYVACGVEAWAADGLLLKDSGYQLELLEWVDQFPHTPHYEILSVWKETAPVP